MLNKPYKTYDTDNGTIKVYGNNHNVSLIYGFELSDKERKEFDYLTNDEIEESSFFRYKGDVYNLGDFMNIHNRIYNPNPPKWMLDYDGYNNDSFFSGILIKLDDTGESVKVYTYIS